PVQIISFPIEKAQPGGIGEREIARRSRDLECPVRRTDSHDPLAQMLADLRRDKQAVDRQEVTAAIELNFDRLFGMPFRLGKEIRAAIQPFIKCTVRTGTATIEGNLRKKFSVQVQTGGIQRTQQEFLLPGGKL